MVEVSSRDELFCLMQGKAKGSTCKIPNPLKYHNKPTTINGIKFASKKEAQRYQTLKLRQINDEIRGLELQPKFELQPAFEKGGKKYRAITYIADFKYYLMKERKLVVEDTKGYRHNPVFLIKQKMFHYTHPDLDLVIR